jgi:hypothetical protein
VVVVFVGAVLGGGLYLASNRKRRKNLLRDRTKALLAIYADKLKEFVDGTDGKKELPVWSIENYLGEDEANWYTIKTDAILEFDGAVQTIWSGIHWARSEEDLDGIAAEVDALETKIVPWVTAAKAAGKLEEESAKEPTASSEAVTQWEALRTPRDSRDLLAQVRAAEPIDGAAGKSSWRRPGTPSP